MRRILCLMLIAAATLVPWRSTTAQGAAARRHVAATADREIRTWDAFVIDAVRSGDLRRQSSDRDPMLPARTVERFQQYYKGVPVWGADIVRDSDAGVAHAIFGELLSPATLSVDPAFDLDRAASILQSRGGDDATLLSRAELVILPIDGGDPRLAYMSVVSTPALDVQRIFVDATSGAELLRYSERHTQSAVGTGRGVLGDQKKISTALEAGTYYADDRLRPPSLRTFDMRGNVTRTINALNGVVPLLSSDRASDADNDWTDGQAVDAHVNIGWTYDFYFKRFGRRGLDNRDRPLVTMIDAVSPQQGVTQPGVPADFVINAFWCGLCGPGAIGVMFFGSGIPSNFFLVSSGQTVTPLAGALDVTAHELTHGVTESTSGLLGSDEPGALNEAFSDMMGTSVEFFFQTPGTGLGQADYLMGEDSFRPSRPGSISGIRSLESPAIFGQPDHYSKRQITRDDNGGVHANSTIPSHAFYLAIEGGVNRTSGLVVQGVGAANREQIEKVFYRGFTLLLPRAATFSTARAVTIQSARDLYGIGGAVERAVTQAWTAVGVP